MTEPAYPALDAEIAYCIRCISIRTRVSEMPAEVLRLIHVIGGHPTGEDEEQSR